MIKMHLSKLVITMILYVVDILLLSTHIYISILSYKCIGRYIYTHILICVRIREPNNGEKAMKESLCDTDFVGTYLESPNSIRSNTST